MDRLSRLVAIIALACLWLSAQSGLVRADEPDPARDDQLSLADLAGYRAALSGKATADDARPSDPPLRLGFRDLWDRTDAHRGRRVTVRGRVARIFRQGPVGSFPALVQVWIFSPAGDPFCLVFPRASDEATGRQQTTKAEAKGDREPDNRPGPTSQFGPGHTVRFTGTFLKMVRYAGGDGERLAPLIVGDRPPAPAPTEAGGPGEHPSKSAKVLPPIAVENRDGDLDRWGWSPASWGLAATLAMIAAVILARQHLRAAPVRSRSAMWDRLLDSRAPEPPLQFIDQADDSRV
ncbi:MAG: hypothetical protein ACLQGP_27510 [Isosphaeraceae bacterium]